MLLWSSMGKPGDVGDHLGDKISDGSDQGLEIRRICQLDLWDCCCAASECAAIRLTNS